MKKKQAVMAVLFALTLATGCAPGRISEYTAKAQRTGEAMFEGRAEDVLSERTETAGTENAGETESTAVSENAGETERTGVPESTGETEYTETAGSTAAAETESAADGRGSCTEKMETESAAVTGTESRDMAETAGGIVSETESAVTAHTPVEIPALFAAVPEEISVLLDQKSADFTGKLAGKDELFWTEEKALEAVLSQERYDDKTLCIQNMARYDGKDKGSFLLLFESTPLTARQRIQGDLWYFDGAKAAKLLDDKVFTGVQLVTGEAAPYLIVRMQEEKQAKAAVYTVTAEGVQASFTDAVLAEPADGGIRVDYPAEAFRYDPLAGEWADGDGTAADSAYRKELEEKFYTGAENGSEYQYEFFAVGDDRIGYRQRRVGQASENGGEIDHTVAEYTWGVSELDNGKLKKDGASLSGEGYYFENRSEREQELEDLNEIPAQYQARQIGGARRTMRAAEKKALVLVLAAQEYPEDALCFVSAADFDGNGIKEAFVSVGSYDGAFGAPVCDLWYAGENAQLLAEGILFQTMEKTGTGNTSAQLVKGYEVSGTGSLLYTVKDGVPARCLEQMGRFEVNEAGELLAWAAGEEMSAPEYFHMERGTAVPYGVEEILPETLLDYENGSAVYKSLLRQAGNDAVKISCLRRENGLIHVTFSDGDTRFYETYEIRDGKLLLTDSGDGGYSPARAEETAQKTDRAEETARTQETVQAEEITEAGTASAETQTESSETEKE